jgi:hypothetical protein
MDLDDPVIRKFIKDTMEKQPGFMTNVLELLNASEEDREELYEKIDSDE